MVFTNEALDRMVEGNLDVVRSLTFRLGENRARNEVRRGLQTGAEEIVVWRDALSDWEAVYVMPGQSASRIVGELGYSDGHAEWPRNSVLKY